MELIDVARQIRYEILKMSYHGEAPHLGSSLSCVELLVAAYFQFLHIDPQSPTRDRFILSKGHAITALYATLAQKGIIPKEALSSFNLDGSSLTEHPIPYGVPGVEMATGSLGHGLSVGLGQALAGQMRKTPFKVMVLLSDGECNEGSVWEAALFAPKQKLDNLIAIVDFNKWQATGRSEEVTALSPLKEKWEAFGWQAYEINGNDFDEILSTFKKIPETRGKPTAIIAHTIKGKGVSFMEDDNNWHYKIPNEEEMEKAKIELGIA